MLRPLLAAVLAAACVALPARAADPKPADADVATHIIAMERAALDVPDGSRFLEISAPDVIYLDPEISEPIVGLKALTDYYALFANAEPSTVTMSSTHVQVIGDVAILTYCVEAKKVKSGKTTLWNVVEVYRKTGGDWRIVNSHYAYKQPKLAAE